MIFHTDNWYYLAIPGNFDHNIAQSGRMFLTRFSSKPHDAKPNMESAFLQVGVDGYVISSYATHRDGVYEIVD